MPITPAAITARSAHEARLPRALIESAGIFLIALLSARWAIQQWNGFPDFDGHYHYTIAQWMAARREFWLDIPWLPYTILGNRGPDHHWLWHAMLTPFTLIQDAERGLIWASAFNAALVVSVFNFVLRMLGVPLAPMFAVLGVTAAVLMPYRLMMLRAQNIAVIFMLLSIWAIAARRHILLGLIAFLFMQSYHAGIILAPIAVIACAIWSLAERRLVLTPLIAVVAGQIVAMLANPWYPANIEYFLFHVLYKESGNLVAENLSSLVGSEWYPASFRVVLVSAWPAHVTLVVSLAALLWRARRISQLRCGLDTLLALGVTILSLALYFRAVRFGEYYVPMACLTAGLAVRDVWSPVRWEWLRAALLSAWMAIGASVGISVAIRTMMPPADYLEQIGSRLAALGQPGDTVYNSKWEDFAPLLWRANQLQYVNGLDGHYLAYRDPARFAIWIGLPAGKIENPARAIAGAFSARFAVISSRHADLADQLAASPNATLLVASKDGWLFEIKP